MEIRLYNSWSNKIETLRPIKSGRISMYVCGPTVYDYVHVGNLRPVVVFDVLRRFLEYMGYKVMYVSNYTDIDDKIIQKALSSQKNEREIADFFIKAYEEDVLALNSRLPTITPRVASFINEIIDYIGRLIEKGAAYVVDGEVFFNIASIQDYGHLSNMKTDELIIGARVEESFKKRSPLDFILWKKTTEGISFDSPWGKGRPGWHTECAVMINSLFKDKLIDIHGGGFDLKFPHHDNEIAQSMAINGTRLANVWMHNGFITLNDDKMSKSRGNIFSSKQALSEIGGPALRLMLLATHYRLPVNLTESFLENAKVEINKMTLAMRQVAVALQLAHFDVGGEYPLLLDSFLTALSDDLNTSNALTSINDLIKEINRELRVSHRDYPKLASCFFTLKMMFNILGLDIKFPILSTADRLLFVQYQQLKDAKDYQGSDTIRAQLIARGLL